ncbi:hypothetical protein QQS21_006126 [Conoideocrella luteorostrata]|uniref:NACHT domain-containing protein n=1 Tax=Conoideocrella luteorostrata TaxID=1105319 RepID=A0AAJ0CSE9_9HYPO|nr:hypothetical protein QQS21_006126 [Conoideocrella luteorostrata]
MSSLKRVMTVPKDTVYRVTGLPASKTEDGLRTAIRALIEEKLPEDERHLIELDVAIMPDCAKENTWKVALVKLLVQKQEHNELLQFPYKLESQPTGIWQTILDGAEISFDRHFHGFTQLNTPKTDSSINADIVAITGFSAHPYGSWRGKGELRKMWLKDFLPEDFPYCRILTYGYESSLINYGISRTMDYSEMLIDELKLIRNTEETKKRPLFFIAHSYGGTILGQYLSTAGAASEEDDELLSALYKATYGMLLFAVPHNGSNVSNMKEMVEDMGNGARGEVLDDISPRSSVLRQQRQAFANAIEDRKIISFYEQKQTRMNKKDLQSEKWIPRAGDYETVVDIESAVLYLPNETKIALNADHSDMVKFDSERDRGYRLGLEYLRKFEKDSKAVVARRFNNVSTASSSIRPYQSTVSEADEYIRRKRYSLNNIKIERLCRSPLPVDQCYVSLAILERPTERIQPPLDTSDSAEQPPSASIDLAQIFELLAKRNKCETSKRRIIIYGQAGVGKTTLCKKIVHDFIHGKESALHQAWAPLFDRLLWVPLRNLKRKKPPVSNYEEMLYNEYFKVMGKNGQRLAEELWEKISSTEGDKTLFLLDGLDEVAYDLINDDFLVDLLNNRNVIITSRPYTQLPVSLDDIGLRLETIGFGDDQIRQYIAQDSSTKASADAIFPLLDNRPTLLELLRIPVQLDAFCSTILSSSQNEIPETLTGIYEALVDKLLAKDARRLDKISPQVSHTAHAAKIDLQMKEETSLIECMAFSGLYASAVDFNAQDRNEVIKASSLKLAIDETLGQLSFFKTSDPSLDATQQTFHFLHMTYQEYFAARYFVRQWRQGRKLSCISIGMGTTHDCLTGRSLIRKRKYDPRYNIFWRFVIGLLQGHSDEPKLCQLFEALEEEPRDIIGVQHLLLMVRSQQEVTSVRRESPLFGEIYKKTKSPLEHWVKFWIKIRTQFHGKTTKPTPISALCELLPDSLVIDAFRKVCRDDDHEFWGKVCKERPETLGTLFDLSSTRGTSNWLITMNINDIRSYRLIPEQALKSFVKLLKSPDSAVAEKSHRALQVQIQLPQSILQDLAGLLHGSTHESQHLMLSALEWRENIPELVFHKHLAFVPLFPPSCNTCLQSVSHILRRQSTLSKNSLPDFVLHDLIQLLRNPKFLTMSVT